MIRIKKILAFNSWFILMATSSANAGLKEIVDQPVLMVVLNCLLLLFMLAGFLLSSRIRSFLRGGELILGWFLILISFLFLLGSQILEFGVFIHLFDVSITVVYFTRLLWIMVLVLGIYFVQKVMS